MDDTTKGGVSKLLRALDDTRRYLRQKGKELAAECRMKEDELRAKVAECQRLAEAQGGGQLAAIAELKEAKAELKKLEMVKACGWAKRAKLKWAAEGDFPTKFFFAKLKQNRKRNHIPPLPDDEGVIHKGEGLVKLVKKHYAAFLTEEPRLAGWRQEWAKFKRIPWKVIKEQQELLDRPFSCRELEKSLKALPNNKTPSRDGFTKEFFVWGWSFISPILM